MLESASVLTQRLLYAIIGQKRGDGMRYNEGKEIITRESIHAEVLKKIRSERRPYLVYMIVYAIEGLLVGGAASYIVDAIFQVMQIVQICVIILFCIPAAIYCATKVRRVQNKYVRAKRREYSIVEDAVYRIADNEYITDNDRWGRLFDIKSTRSGNYYADVIYFENRGKIISRQNVLDYTFAGDVFYVVVFNTKSEDPILAYSKKIYELRE